MSIEPVDTCRREQVVAPADIRVWDRGVRSFHWLLVGSVAGALATGFLDEKWLLDAHVIFGTVIAVLIVLRLVWGFTGTTYARFSSFVCRPSTVLAHARDLACRRAEHHVGHNPLGAMMILGLLAGLVALVVTGIFVLGGVVKEGPLAAFTTFAQGRSAKEAHEALAFGLLGLVALHVTGIVVESLRSRENLVRAMLTGAKRDRPEAIAVQAVAARPMLAAGVAALVLIPAASGIGFLSQRPALGVPVAPLDAAYIRECKACHAVHHPSLASTATWTGIMGNLGDHFGDNASLDPGVTASLVDYLTTNSAEHWDTKAANRLRKASAAEPLRITATDGWKRIHRDIPGEVFKRKAVGGKLNCANCHTDAETGLFAPRAIHVPKEKTTP